MRITFKEITLHHFLSFDEATIQLNDRGYCLVSGINRNPKDAAKSNGSGKSTIWNAISFVLTGETLQGLKSNLGNIYYNDGCWVSLDFTIDGHEYTLLRSRDDVKYGTNLKITVDGVDKSGKGIRESEEVLFELLPDVTSELIGSVILLGQGMPQKFTNNTPAKRKEILEHLSKSDYMIQDLKNRVESRSIELSKNLREVEDKTTSMTAEKGVYARQLEGLNAELLEASKPTNYDEMIFANETTYKQYEDELKQIEQIVITKDAEYKNSTTEFTKLSTARQNALDQVRAQHEEFANDFNKERSELTGKLYALKTEIDRLKSIKDVCPTCGQKIPGAVKPDTSKQEEEYNKLNESLIKLTTEISEDNKNYNEVLNKIREEYDGKIAAQQQSVSALGRELSDWTSKKDNLIRQMAIITSTITQIKTKQENHEANLARIKKNIEDTTALMSDLDIKLKQANERQVDITKHIDVISKMSTYLKRDFRGFLLTNVIDYIATQAKQYCSQIFGSDEITFALEGNNIDIAYCNKDYENLSGGEKQRVDLIIQFAIRDMLCNYLGFSSNILVLDEITDNLDSISCDKVLNFITKELSSVESVFIISHHSDELEIPNDSEIIVEKNTEGVSHVIS